MKPAYSKVSPVNICGRKSNRLMIVLRTSGCEYAKKNNGGCTICGFNKNAIDDIKDEEIIAQFSTALNQYSLDNVDEIDILTLGSFFNDNEISKQTRVKLLEMVAKISHIKRISIESRAEYVTIEKLKSCKKILKDKILDFGIGLESSDDYLRNEVINKNLSKEDFENVVQLVKVSKSSLLVYLLIKPPSLSERQAIDDAISSAKYVFQIAKKYDVSSRVAFEPVFISEDTNLEKLYLNSKYRILNLWSVVEVIKNIYKYGNIFVGLSDENLSKDRMPSSCPICDDKIIEAIEYFNETQDISHLLDLDCECKNIYLEKLILGEL